MTTNDTITKHLSLRLLAIILVLPLVLAISALKSSDPQPTETSAPVAMVADDAVAVSDDENGMVAIPEPSTLFLFGASAAFLALFLRGKSAASKLGELGGLENLKEQKEQKEVGVANILK